MRLTHHGHACLLVEAAGVRLLIDPGAYSDDFTGLRDLDAVLLTHQHADHTDPDRLPALLAGNPGVRVVADPQTAELLAGFAVDAEPMQARGSATLGALTVEGAGELHAFNHGGVPRCTNTGFVVTAPSEPTLFHPGDAYDADPGRSVDVLALPVNAPWTAIRETLEFVNRIGPRWVVPVHDALLSAQGREGYLNHVDAFTPKTTVLKDLSGQGPWDVA